MTTLQRLVMIQSERIRVQRRLAFDIKDLIAKQEKTLLAISAREKSLLEQLEIENKRLFDEKQPLSSP